MAHKTVPRHVLITGSPGVGKTTIIKRVVTKLKQSELFHINGFYTEEIREGRMRKGFDVVQIHSKLRGTLARKSCDAISAARTVPMVGQYQVDVKSFEDTALPTLAVMEKCKQLLVVDEIGKMELFSSAFCNTVEHLFEMENIVILATIPMSKGKPIRLVDKLKGRPDVKLLMVTKDNRQTLEDEIIQAYFKELCPTYPTQNGTKQEEEIGTESNTEL